LEPLATIWPLSLIAVALSRVNPEPSGIRLVEVLEHPSAPDPRPEAGLANDHAVVIDRPADWIKAEGPQVSYRAVAPHKHMRGFAGGVRPASHLAVVVDRVRGALGAAGGLGRCRRGWRDGDETGDIPAED
jgi:hypothetical protein